MEGGVNQTAKPPVALKQTSLKINRKLFAQLLWIGISLVIISFLLYKFLLQRAFVDRGVARNYTPAHFIGSTSKTKQNILLTAQHHFKCTNRHKVDISHLNSVGMFPYLLKSDLETCNKASDFVGYERFINAMLHGEEHLGQPASSSESISYDHHHPGLEILKLLHGSKKKFDRSVEFYWWLFPIPMGIPNRGFSYAIFKGDYANLETAAVSVNLSFYKIFTEGLNIFLAFQGWDVESGSPHKETIFSYDDKDHVVTKAWISLHCFNTFVLETQSYDPDRRARLIKYKMSLEAFMESQLIRYPSDFTC